MVTKEMSFDIHMDGRMVESGAEEDFRSEEEMEQQFERLLRNDWQVQSGHEDDGLNIDVSVEITDRDE